MEETHRESADRMRLRIESELHDPAEFLGAVLSVPPQDRDAWLDLVLGLRELPDDGAELPRGCVPYFPCPVDALLRMVEQANVRASDVFVDLGSGLGRAAAFVHLLTGASVIAIEIQSELVVAARALATRLSVPRVSCIQGDAVKLARFITVGSVFFLYCPFSGERLAKVLADLEDIARTKTIRICCVDVPLPPRPWLSIEPAPSADLTVYRSTLLDERPDAALVQSSLEPRLH